MDDAPLDSDAYTAASFSMANRLSRLAWNGVYLLLFRFSPRPFHAWRSFLLRIFGAKIGRECHIYPKAVIWAPWNLICGEQVGVADEAVLYNQAIITLGRRCVISQGSYLCTGTHDYSSKKFTLYAKPIVVGSEAWIAAQCFVHPGISIGEGAVIGARSVVTKDMPAWMVCAGNPCQPLKTRVLNS